jgi:hypothetical protein
MDWNFSIERNRGMLLGAVVGLFAMIGLAEGSMVDRLSRPIHRRALRILRSAESAVRRLIIVMARDIKVEPRPKRPAPSRPVNANKGKSKVQGQGQGQGNTSRRPPSFNLFDRDRRSDFGKPGRQRRPKGRKDVEPRIRVLGYDPRIPEFLRGPDPTPAPVVESKVAVKDGTVSAKRLCRRLFAIVRALQNMEREAERYARWWATPIEERRPRRERALRFGWPPGWRIKSTHEVDDILKECHWLVRSLPEPDTS